jgi:dTMP kinase
LEDRENALSAAPFVTFEGIEGSGKSTQLARLSAHLTARGIAHRVTREPGGTPLADQIRSLLLSPRDEAVFAETELLLYAAARAQHVRGVVLPALAEGLPVLCDRFCDATVAYQGAARGLDAGAVAWLNAFAADEATPTLTLLIDVPVEAGFARVSARGGRPDRLERESARFHERVREGYLELAAREPGRIVVVDGTPSADEVSGAVLAVVSERFSW